MSETDATKPNSSPGVSRRLVIAMIAGLVLLAVGVGVITTLAVKRQTAMRAAKTGTGTVHSQTR